MAVLGVTVLFTALAAVLLQLDFLFLLIRFFFYEKMNSHFFTGFFLIWEVKCWYPQSFIMCYNSKFMFIVWKKGKITSLKSKSKWKSMFLLYQYSDFILDVWLINLYCSS